MQRRNFLSGLASLPLFRSILRLVLGGKVFDGLIAHTTTDRAKAGLRGPVKTCVEETSYPTGKFLTTTEYGLDGTLLTTRISNPDGSEWVTTKTYDADGRLVKASSGKSGEPATESLYTYDERGRLKEITNADGKGNRTSYRYDEPGRETEIRTFGHEVFERNRGGVMVAGSLWDAAQIGIGAVEGGSVTTVFDERDLPIELQILDSEGRVVSQFVRTYDANGRIMEENQIQENPPLASEIVSELNDKQLATLKSLFRGKNGTGKSFVYDSEGRVAEERDRNWGLDKLTTTKYNEHGDISEQRETATSNLAFPVGGGAFSIGEDGTIIPDRREGVPEPPPSFLERTSRTIHEYRYVYDQNGNWTERTVVFRQEVEGSAESGEYSTVYRRTLTYF
ncbi:MAG TPA: RHS repeat domain-containing protein [Candidatus Acidoferrum sp.]|nr:RHS repeat domain-containing protein [Candidatus Acidoferrum sp.]